MSSFHSIWLMPCAEDAALLDDIVRRLAARFAGEPFVPHLTLVEDMARAADDLAAVLRDGFAGTSGFAAPIAAIDTSRAFFRSLYAAFAPEGRLLETKRTAVARFGVGDVASFMPHVSLAYGAPEAVKPAAAAELAAGLVGRTVRFDAIAVVASAQSIPIRDWAIVARHPLP